MMDLQEMHEVMSGVKSFAALLMSIDRDKLERLCREMESFDTTGPIFFPSEWMRDGDAIRENAKILRVILKARSEMEEVKEGITL